VTDPSNPQQPTQGQPPDPSEPSASPGADPLASAVGRLAEVSGRLGSATDRLAAAARSQVAAAATPTAAGGPSTRPEVNEYLRLRAEGVGHQEALERSHPEPTVSLAGIGAEGRRIVEDTLAALREVAPRYAPAEAAGAGAAATVARAATPSVPEAAGAGAAATVARAATPSVPEAAGAGAAATLLLTEIRDRLGDLIRQAAGVATPAQPQTPAGQLIRELEDARDEHKRQGGNDDEFARKVEWITRHYGGMVQHEAMSRYGVEGGSHHDLARAVLNAPQADDVPLLLTEIRDDVRRIEEVTGRPHPGGNAPAGPHTQPGGATPPASSSPGNSPAKPKTRYPRAKTFWGGVRQGLLRRAGRAFKSSQFGRTISGIGKAVDKLRGAKTPAARGRAVVALGGKVGGGALMAVGALLAFRRAVIDAAEAALQTQRKYTEVSASMAAVFAQLDTAETFRNMEKGERLAGSTRELARAVDKSREADKELDILVTGVGNRVKAFFVEAFADVKDVIVHPVAKAANKFLGQGAPDDGKRASTAQDQIQDMERRADQAQREGRDRMTEVRRYDEAARRRGDWGDF